MPETTYREALRQALRWQLVNDERVFLMGEDIGAYGGSYAVTKGFLEEFGERLCHRESNWEYTQPTSVTVRNSLAAPQHRRWIDTRRAARRQIGGDDGRERQAARRDNERCGIASGHIVEEARNQP